MKGSWAAVVGAGVCVWAGVVCVATPMPRSAGDGVTKVLKMTEKALREIVREEGGDRGAPSSTLLLFLPSSSSFSSSSIKQVTEGWGGGVGVFQATPHQGHNLTCLLSRAKQVRTRSSRVVMAVVATDEAFLNVFARSSVSSRLVVWSVRLVVLARLPPPRVDQLLPAHWNLRMMNAMLVNLVVEGEGGYRCDVYTHLPFSPGGGAAQVVRVASWTPAAGLETLTPDLAFFPDKYENFHGGTINITALEFMPLWGQKIVNTTTTYGPTRTTATTPANTIAGVTFAGWNAKLLLTIAQELNFSIHLMHSATWDEVTAGVAARRSFFVPMPYILLDSRLKNYYFTYTFEFSAMAFVMAVPSLSPSWVSLFLPFSGGVWVATCFTTCVVLPVVMRLVYRERRQDEKEDEGDESEEETYGGGGGGIYKIVRKIGRIGRQEDRQFILGDEERRGIRGGGGGGGIGRKEEQKPTPEDKTSRRRESEEKRKEGKGVGRGGGIRRKEEQKPAPGDEAGQRRESEGKRKEGKGGERGGGGGRKTSTTNKGRPTERTLRMLLGQDLPGPLPSYASYRVLVAAWMVFSLVLGTVYRGNLTAAMTLPKYPKRIETVQELVKGVDRINMPPYGADHKESYKRSGSRVLRAVGELIQIVETIEGIGRALKNRREAHADDLHYLQQVTTQDYTSRGGKELLYVGKQNIFASPSAWPVPHDAPYTDHINHVMLRVIETGLYHKWMLDVQTEEKHKSRSKWRREKTRKKEEVKEEEEEETNQEEEEEEEAGDGGPAPLSVSHLQGLFLLFFLGLILAFVSFIVEVSESYKHKFSSSSSSSSSSSFNSSSFLSYHC